MIDAGFRTNANINSLDSLDSRLLRLILNDKDLCGAIQQKLNKNNRFQRDSNQKSPFNTLAKRSDRKRSQSNTQPHSKPQIKYPQGWKHQQDALLCRC